MDQLTRDDLITILVALKQELTKWETYLEYDKQRLDDHEHWIGETSQQVERFKGVYEKVQKILGATPR